MGKGITWQVQPTVQVMKYEGLTFGGDNISGRWEGACQGRHFSDNFPDSHLWDWRANRKSRTWRFT